MSRFAHRFCWQLREVRPVRAGGLTLLLLAACASRGEPAEVALETRFVAPKGLLDTVTKVTLSVYEASATVTCDAPKGISTAKDDTPKVTSRELSRTGCAPGVKYCGDLRVTQSDTERVFVALATDASNERIAQGCTTARVTSDTVPLDIKLVRAIPPSTCGNNVIEGLEQCDPPSGTACTASCTTEETHLSQGSTAGNTKSGAANEKGDTSLFWREGASSRLFAFFTDKSSGKTDVGLRALDSSFLPLASPAAVAQGFVYLPNGSAPAEPAANAQSSARATALGDKTWVVFQGESATAGNSTDIALRSFDASSFVQGELAPIGVNGPNGSGEAGGQTAAAVAAGENGKLFVAWQDESGGPGSGRIFGRTFSPPNVLGNQQELSTGTSNARPRVTAVPTGFVLVWESGGDVKLRVVSLDGTPAGGESVVNEKAAGVQERPAIASLADGRFAIVWADRSTGNADIVLQRFTAQVVKIAGDQAQPINDLVKDGDQTSPAIAGTAARAGTYLVAWADVPRGDIRARYTRLAEGFPFNPVDGSDSEFSVGTRAGRKRSAPSVAVGGKDPFAAVAWDDQAAQTPGIYGRRLPIPAK